MFYVNQEKKSRHGLTICKNKQSVSTAESSSSHLNHGAHQCDTVSNRSSPSYSTKDILSNISQVRTRSTTKKLRHCLENHKGYYLRNGDEEECSGCSLSRDD